MYGLDVFMDVLVDADGRGAAEAVPGLGGPARRPADRVPDLGVFGGDALTIGDAGAVCAVIEPEGIRTERHPVRVETGTGAARGQTVVDRRAWVGETEPVRSDGDGTPSMWRWRWTPQRYRELWLAAFSG